MSLPLIISLPRQVCLILKSIWKEAQKLTPTLSRARKTIVNRMGSRSWLIVPNARGSEAPDGFHALPSQDRLLPNTRRVSSRNGCRGFALKTQKDNNEDGEPPPASAAWYFNFTATPTRYANPRYHRLQPRGTSISQLDQPDTRTRDTTGFSRVVLQLHS